MLVENRGIDRRRRGNQVGGFGKHRTTHTERALDRRGVERPIAGVIGGQRKPVVETGNRCDGEIHEVVNGIGHSDQLCADGHSRRDVALIALLDEHAQRCVEDGEHRVGNTDRGQRQQDGKPFGGDHVVIGVADLTLIQIRLTGHGIGLGAGEIVAVQVEDPGNRVRVGEHVGDIDRSVVPAVVLAPDVDGRIQEVTVYDGTVGRARPVEGHFENRNAEAFEPLQHSAVTACRTSDHDENRALGRRILDGAILRDQLCLCQRRDPGALRVSEHRIAVGRYGLIARIEVRCARSGAHASVEVVLSGANRSVEGPLPEDRPELLGRPDRDHLVRLVGGSGRFDVLGQRGLHVAGGPALGVGQSAFGQAVAGEAINIGQPNGRVHQRMLGAAHDQRRRAEELHEGGQRRRQTERDDACDNENDDGQRTTNTIHTPPLPDAALLRRRHRQRHRCGVDVNPLPAVSAHPAPFPSSANPFRSDRYTRTPGLDVAVGAASRQTRYGLRQLPRAVRIGSTRARAAALCWE